MLNGFYKPWACLESARVAVHIGIAYGRQGRGRAAVVTCSSRNVPFRYDMLNVTGGTPCGAIGVFTTSGVCVPGGYRMRVDRNRNIVRSAIRTGFVPGFVETFRVS